MKSKPSKIIRASDDIHQDSYQLWSSFIKTSTRESIIYFAYFRTNLTITATEIHGRMHTGSADLVSQNQKYFFKSYSYVWA